MQQLSLLIILCLLLMGCASRAPDQQAVMLSNEIQFNLLPPLSFGKKITLTQVATIRANKQHHELIFQLEIADNIMTVVAFQSTGIKLFTVLYDGQTIKSHGNAAILKNIKPQYLLADIQLSLWPVEVLKTLWFNQLDCYKQSKCQFIESENQRQRRLLIENNAIVTIEFDRAPPKRYKSEYFHHQRNYRIQLETIEQN